MIEEIDQIDDGADDRTEEHELGLLLLPPAQPPDGRSWWRVALLLTGFAGLAVGIALAGRGVLGPP